MLKRTSWLALVALTTSIGIINASVQAQTATAAEQLKVVVASSSTMVPNLTENDIAVSCPQGTLAIGGGGQMSPNGVANAYLTASSPYPVNSPTPTGWHIIGTNVSGGELTMTVYALCAQLK